MNLRGRILLITIPINIIAITCIYLIVKTDAYDTVEKLTNNDTHSLLNSAMLSIKNQYNSLEYHKEYVTELRKRERKQIVGIAKTVVEEYYHDFKKGEISEKEAKKQAIRKLNDFRYDNGNGYLWINDTEKPIPRMINHPFYPEYNGRLTRDPMFFTTTDSVNIFLLATNICEKQGGGFIEYMWKKPDQIKDSLPKPKTSYVELFEPWQWIIGTGVYLEDIQADVDSRMSAIRNELKQTMGSMKLGKTGYFFIFNSKHDMLLNPLIDSNTPDSVTNLVIKNTPFDGFVAASKTEAKSYEYMWYNSLSDITSKNQRRKVFVEYFEPLDWYVCASFSYDELAEPGIILGKKILYISAIFILISIAVILYLSDSLIKPLNELMRFVARIPRNFLNVNLTKVPAFRSYEANALGKVITEMLMSIREQQGDLIKEKAKAIESEAILRSTLESIDDALLIVGDNGHISHYNQSFVKLFSFPEELLVQNDDRLLLSFAMEQIRDPEVFVRGVNEIYSKGMNEHDLIYFKDGRIIDRQFYPLIEESPVKGGVWIFNDVTERVKNEEALIENEQKLQSLFRVTPSGIGIVKDRVFVDVNPHFCLLTGYSKEELIGTNSRKLYSSKEEYLRVGRELYLHLAELGTTKAETQWKRKDGNIIYVYVFLSAIDRNDLSKGTTFATFDITEKRQYEEALEKRVLALTLPLDDIGSIEFTDLFNIDHLQQLQDAFANATGVASIITYPDGTPITKPSNFCRLCNIVRSTEKGLQNCIKSDARIGKSNLKGPNIQPCFSAGLWDAGSSITLGGVHVANWLIGQVRNKDVNEDDIIAYADVIGIDRKEFINAFNEVNAMSRDNFQAVTDALYLLSNEISLKTYQNVQQARFISEQKKAEEERKMMNIELERRVEERTAQLQQANKDLEAFAYSVSHDLRAPIRHIDGFMHLLDKSLGSADVKVLSYIDKVLLSSKNMSTMIDELLQFSRLGRTDLKSRMVNLTEIIEEIITIMRPDYEGRDVKWIINSLPEIYGDPALLKIAFENLISNAIKYTSKKEKAVIEIGVKETNLQDMVCIFIKDNGTGFDMAYKDKLFGVFQRLHKSEEFEGTGIGLANVYRIIKKHNGEINAEGEVDKGATFYITLPGQGGGLRLEG